jgi:hypothetical protein
MTTKNKDVTYGPKTMQSSRFAVWRGDDLRGDYETASDALDHAIRIRDEWTSGKRPKLFYLSPITGYVEVNDQGQAL